MSTITHPSAGIGEKAGTEQRNLWPLARVGAGIFGFLGTAKVT